MIESGKVEVTRKTPSGEEVALLNLSQNEYFGEQALLHNLPRNANVKAIGKCIPRVV